jgi:hypothetical protein
VLTPGSFAWIVSKALVLSSASAMPAETAITMPKEGAFDDETEG